MFILAMVCFLLGMVFDHYVFPFLRKRFLQRKAAAKRRATRAANRAAKISKHIGDLK